MKNFCVNTLVFTLVVVLLGISLVDTVLASDGFVAYRSNSGSGLNYPKVRYWNSSGTGTFGSEVELPTAGSPVRQAVIKTSPLSTKTILITSSDDGYMDAYVCFYNCTNVNEWTVTNDFAQIPAASAQRRFDTAFESKTENFIVVYALSSANTSIDLTYKILNNNALSFNDSTEYYIDDTGAASAVVYTWVAMDANPLANSTEIALTGFDSTNTDTNAWIWDGNAWENQTSVAESSTVTTGYEALAVKYATNGTIAMVMGGNGTVGNVNWRYWSGGSWSAKQTFDVDAADGNDVRFLSLKTDPVSSRMQAISVDSGSDLCTMYWNGTTWTIQANVDTGLDIGTRRPADFSWLPSGSSGILVWDTDTTGTTISRRICAPTCSGATATVGNYAGTGAWLTLFRNINASDTADVIGIRMNSVFNVGSFYYNGAAFNNYGDTALASTATSSVYESFSMDFLKSYALPLILYYVSPTDDNDSAVSRNWSYVNISTANPTASCTLNWNGTNYSMSGSGNSRYYNVTGLSIATYTYYVTCNTSFVSRTLATRTLIVNTSISVPIITFVYPTPGNNTLWENPTLFINVTTNKNVSSCEMDISGTIYNMSSMANNWYVSLYPIYSGRYDYNVSCLDFYSNVGYTETRNLTVDVDLAYPDAFVAYRSYISGSGETYPKVRFWNSSGSGTFESEVELPDSGSPLRQVVLKISPKSSKIVVITSSDDGFLDEYICLTDCMSASSWTVYNNFAQSIATSTQRRYDFVFESQTGDMIVVYAITSTNVSRDLAYRILDDSSANLSESIEKYIDDISQGADVTYTWVAMDANPTNSSCDIAMIGFDGTSSDVNAWIWNGTLWNTEMSISDVATGTTGYEALAIRYNINGSGAMAIAGNFTNGNVNWRYWDGAAWGVKYTFDVDGTDLNDVRWLSLKPDPTSLDFQAVAVDSGSDLTTMYYSSSGGTWTITTNIDTGLDLSTRRLADFAWLPEGGSGILVWDTDGALTTLSQRVCSPNCNSATSTISTYGGSGGWITLFRNIQISPIAKIIGIRLNSLFQTGAFYYDGTSYVNYGDDTLATGDYTNAYEYYSMDFTKKNTVPVIITYEYPTYADGASINGTFAYVNITISPPYATCVLNWSGTLYDMEGTGLNRFYNVTMSTGTYDYYVTCNTSKLSADSPVRTLSINSTSNTVIFLMSPQDNNLYTDTLVLFEYNVSNLMYAIQNCSLIINNTLINITTSSPVPQDTILNFTASLNISLYNWSINCTSAIGSVSSSPTYNVSVAIPPVIDSIFIDDYILPANSLILSAGSTRNIFCNVVASDSLGPGNLASAAATFYYSLNSSDDPDELNVHYTNSSCSINDTTALNRTFACAFNVIYYANNGTWNCNASVYNNQSAYFRDNSSTTIQPLYAVNLTDGIDFLDVASTVQSANITANITNFGNMPVNVTLQGYALLIGDNVGMNCSDNTNITITNIRFSTNASDNFNQKTQMNGSIQSLKLKIAKQNTSTQIYNTTYWQITPDPGSRGRVCGGYVIFNAEAS